MVDLHDHQINKLNILYKEKKYLELEKEIESINKKDRPYFLLTLLGVAKYFKKNSTKEDLIDAWGLFDEAYNKDQSNLLAFNNLIVTSGNLKKFFYLINLLKQRINKFGYEYYSLRSLAEANYLIGNVKESLEIFSKILDDKLITKEIWSTFISLLNYTKEYSQKDYLNYCNRFLKKFENYSKDKIVKSEFILKPQKLRIGFLSPDFYGHSIGTFLYGTLEELKKNNFDLIAFNLRKNNLNENKVNKFLFSEWNDVGSLNDVDLINFIKKKKINILIDLAGHTHLNRLLVIKNRAAPIQVSWLGYCNTSGIKEMDYIILDPNLVNKKETYEYVEEIIFMPNIWNASEKLSSDLVVNELPAIKNNFFTFGSFNNFQKISDDVIEVWSKIINKTNSKLILKTSVFESDDIKENILNKFKNNNVDKKKIVFYNKTLLKSDHMKLYNNIDLSLDTFPYPGVTTSFEAIWMGVPVLTMKGNNCVSRYGESINNNVGLKKYIANDSEDYINKAISISQDINNLSILRQSLRKKSLNSTLFDIENFGKNFSTNLSDIWKKYVTTQR